MRSLILVGGLLMSAGIAQAQAPGSALDLIASGRMQMDDPLAQPYAICLTGEGQAEPVTAAFAALGFSAETDGEKGVSYLTRPGAPYYVELYMDRAICVVASEEIPMDEALYTILTLAGTAGLEINYDADCPTLRIGSAIATLSSTGQDPICEPGDEDEDDIETSKLRVEFPDRLRAE